MRVSFNWKERKLRYDWHTIVLHSTRNLNSAIALRGTNCRTVKCDMSIISEQLFNCSLFVVSAARERNSPQTYRFGCTISIRVLQRTHLRNRWLIVTEAAAFSRAVHYSLANVLILSNTRSRGYFSVAGHSRSSTSSTSRCSFALSKAACLLRDAAKCCSRTLLNGNFICHWNWPGIYAPQTVLPALDRLNRCSRGKLREARHEAGTRLTQSVLISLGG